MSLLTAEEITGTVPVSSMFCMIVCAVILIGFSLFCMIWTHNKLDGDGLDIFIGAVGYLIIPLFVVNSVSVAITSISGTADYLTEHVPLLVLYSMSVGILPEVLFLGLFMRFRRKKKHNATACMMFATGYVSMELIMVAGTTVLSNLMIAYTFNNGGVEALAEATEVEAATADFSYLEELIATPYYGYLLSGIEGVLFAVVRIGYILIMYLMVDKGLSKVHFLSIIGLYYLVHLPSAFCDWGLIPSFLIDPLLILICIAEIIGLARVIKNRLPDELAPVIESVSGFLHPGGQEEDG